MGIFVSWDFSNGIWPGDIKVYVYVDSDEPMQPPFKLGSSNLFKSHRKLLSDCEYAQLI